MCCGCGLTGYVFSGVEAEFSDSGITTPHQTLACLEANSTRFVNLYFLSQTHKNISDTRLQTLRLKLGSVNSLN